MADSEERNANKACGHHTTLLCVATKATSKCWYKWLAPIAKGNAKRSLELCTLMLNTTN